jgi:hypothetical protein
MMSNKTIQNRSFLNTISVYVLIITLTKIITLTNSSPIYIKLSDINKNAKNLIDKTDKKSEELDEEDSHNLQRLFTYNENDNQSSFYSTISQTDSSLSPLLATDSQLQSQIVKIFTGLILYSLTCWTIIGNILVLIALCTNKKLGNKLNKENNVLIVIIQFYSFLVGRSNFLIGNLAVCDLLLGLIVLPFSATFDTFEYWYFGSSFCSIWLSVDVLCCTASIWSLLIISYDRYIATNHPIRYRTQSNNKKITILYCTLAWVISIAITVMAPLMFMNSRTSSNHLKMTQDGLGYECVLFTKPMFVILSSLGSFYLPCILMLLLYSRVFIKIRSQQDKFRQKQSGSTQSKDINNKEVYIKIFKFFKFTIYKI